MTTSKFELGLHVGLFIGSILGGIVMLWMVIALQPDPHFITFSKECILSDLGPQWQAYCPTQ
jgi:hypothetical protein